MIDTKRLKGEIVANGYDMKTMAKELGITPKTMYTRMQKGVFGSDEIAIMIRLLKIQDPISIFFTDKVT